MIIVHHGIFWSGVDPSIRDYNRNRIKFLLEKEISLYACHLPLDMHSEVGNNIQLLKTLGFEKDKEFGLYKGKNISFTGKIDKSKSLDEINDILEKKLGATCKVLPFGKKYISRMISQ